MLKLIKKGDKYWLFEDSEIGLFSPSKFTINLLNNVITIVYENGLKSKRYNVSDCEIYDLGATSPFTTSSGDLFMQKLEELNCPCFQKNENTFNISGGAWGDITGDLSNQTDLQNALDSKLNKDTTAGVERAYIINADGSQGTKATSELGTQFKKKSENAAYNDPTLSGTDVVISLQPNGQSVYAFSNAGLVSIDGFGLDLITGNPSAETPYPYKDILIYNNKATDLILKHDGSGTADVKFLLEGGVDLVIPAGGKVWLKYATSYCEMIFKSWSEVDLSTKADLVGGKVPASQLPAYVDDVVEGYFNGTNFYTDAGFTILITGETGKIYVALDTNKTYRWTGSAYVQIGGREIYIQNISVSGGYTVDFNVDTHRLTLTGNTTFSEINLPALGFSKTITLHINGNFGVVFPASWTQYISGAYNGTAPLNTIVIETIGTNRKVQISRPD